MTTTSPAFQHTGITLYEGDSLQVMATMESNSVDSIVTDPPYGISFMSNKHKWDYQVPGPEYWEEALRVAKPGAYLLAFGGTRTFHRLVCAIEDAGWDIRDCIMWVYGQGFPKSLNVSKAIDAHLLHGKSNTRSLRKIEQEGDGEQYQIKGRNNGMFGEEVVWDRKEYTPTTDAAKAWEGWGTALKPAWEPIIVARKPLDGTVAENLLQHGTGAMNIDGCRIGDESIAINQFDDGAKYFGGAKGHPYTQKKVVGRWPSNLAHDGSPEVCEQFPEVSTNRCETESHCDTEGATSFEAMRGNRPPRGYDGDGNASRFYYCAKASTQDRDDGLEKRKTSTSGEKTGRQDGTIGINPYAGSRAETKNPHPTVKPTALMEWLIRLVTKPGGVVLDPFMGSGSTGKAARLIGMRFIGIDKEQNYVDIAKDRIMAISNLEMDLG